MLTIIFNIIIKIFFYHISQFQWNKISLEDHAHKLIECERKEGERRKQQNMRERELTVFFFTSGVFFSLKNRERERVKTITVDHYYKNILLLYTIDHNFIKI